MLENRQKRTVIAKGGTVEKIDDSYKCPNLLTWTSFQTGEYGGGMKIETDRLTNVNVDLNQQTRQRLWRKQTPAELLLSTDQYIHGKEIAKCQRKNNLKIFT
jgi:hypothetical protein